MQKWLKVRFTPDFYLVRDYGLREAVVTTLPDGSVRLAMQPREILVGLEVPPYWAETYGLEARERAIFELDTLAEEGEVIPARFVETWQEW